MEFPEPALPAEHWLPPPSGSGGTVVRRQQAGVWQAEREPECPPIALVTISSARCSYRSCFGSVTLVEVEQGSMWMSFQTFSSGSSSSILWTDL